MKRTESPSRRAVLILGMHRSGTSAATRVINLLGAELGSDLVPPGPDNRDGFWEHAEAVRINDELLHGLGRTWYDMREMPAGWVDSPHAKSAARRIGELIEREFAASSLCVVKDPRMCLTAPSWIDAFEARGFAVDCLFVVRDPREVVESLHRRNDWPRAPLYLMWVQYLMEATAAPGHRRRAMLTYDQLLSDWRGSMARVARELHLCWPIAPDSAASEAIDAFVDPGRRRRPGGLAREAGGEGADMPELAMTLYQACLRIAAGEGRWSAISDLHGLYRGTSQLYATHVEHLLAERWGAERRARTAEARLAEQSSATTVFRDVVRELQERLDTSLQSMGQNLEAVAQQARTMEANVAARLEAQVSATAGVHHLVQQVQDEISGLSGETAARFERQRESVMAVEARLQRQQTLLNTVSLRLEQATRSQARLAVAADDALSRTEMQKLRSALASSNATVAALIASTSWKLTAPMRWLSVRVLRRPPALAGRVALEPAAPGSRSDGPPGTVSDHRHAASADAAAEPRATAARARADRRNGNRESVAFRWDG